MFSRFRKYISAISLAIITVAFGFSVCAQVGTPSLDSGVYSGAPGLFSVLRKIGGPAFGVAQVENIENLTQTQNKNVMIIIAVNVINVIVSILGIVLIAYLIYGGFIWLKSRGNAEEVDRAADIIRQSIIGLVIIAAAFILTKFVVAQLVQATFMR